MGIFDALFGISESKKIYRKDFNRALAGLSDISKEERKYLNEVFKKELKGGLTVYEAKQRIGKLRHNPDDPLDPYEVEHIRKKLLGEIEKK